MFTKAGFYTFVYGQRIANAGAPPFLTLRSSNSFIVATIALAIFTVRVFISRSVRQFLDVHMPNLPQDIFLYSLVVPVLPFALTVRANVAPSGVQKEITIFLSVYGAALAVASPIFGWFADRSNSRRLPLLLGLLALGGSTVMLAVGNSVAILVIGRFLQGISAAVVWTVGLALLSDTVPKEDIGQAMGYVAAATSLGSLLGPLLGGVVYAGAGYYAVFTMGFALIGLDVFLRLMMIEKSVAKQWVEPNETSSDSETSVQNRSSAQNLDTIQPAVAENGSTEKEEITISKNSPKWILRLPPVMTLLRHPRLLAALFGCFVQSTSLASFDSVLPLYVKDIFSWKSTGAGLIFICLVIPALCGPFIGSLSDKYGTRSLTTIGLLAAVPCWVLLRLVTYSSLGQKVLLCALLALLGLTMTMVMAPLMAEIDHTLEVEEKRRPGSLGKRGAAAQGYGLFNLAYALGSLVGPLWAGFVISSAGWGTMTWTIGLLSGVAAIPTFIWTGGRITLKGKERNVGLVV